MLCRPAPQNPACRGGQQLTITQPVINGAHGFAFQLRQRRIISSFGHQGIDHLQIHTLLWLQCFLAGN
jgi:hypothetical protein